MRPGLWVVLPALLAALLATACSNTNLPSFTSATTGPGVTLSKAQLAATHEGVRRMIPNPDSAKFLGDVARREGDEPGIHVCGHVRYTDSDGKTAVEQLYYVELRETNGVPGAERGQVGGDPGKLAKVRFLCREHGVN